MRFSSPLTELNLALNFFTFLKNTAEKISSLMKIKPHHTMGDFFKAKIISMACYPHCVREMESCLCRQKLRD